MIKGKTYHELLRDYIRNIGCTDCPARREEASGCCEDMPAEETRTVGRVVERNGAWEIHLFTVDKHCPCRLHRHRIRTFRSRRMAEIVARYTAAAQSGDGGPAEEGPHPIHWN